MKLLLKRVAFESTYTIGKLYVDGELFCDTLEDKNRDLNHDGDLSDKGESKVFGQTCIPFGTYKVIINMSSRFKKEMPLLLNVPGFEGIRIHPGNTDVDTHGCILVGRNTEKGKITSSAITYASLFEKMRKAKDIQITII